MAKPVLQDRQGREASEVSQVRMGLLELQVNFPLLRRLRLLLPLRWLLLRPLRRLLPRDPRETREIMAEREPPEPSERPGAWVPLA